MPKIDQYIFNQNLALTQRYCAAQSENQQMSIAEIFRSFNPTVRGQPLFSYQDGRSSSQIENNSAPWMMARWAFDPIDQQPAWSIEKLFEDLMVFKEQYCPKQESIGYNGEILIAQIDCTVCDGASEHESLGLIDLYDMPPIDTWFYLTKSNEGRLLYCWIPNSVKHYADEAVAVNCIDCIRWFDQSKGEAGLDEVVPITFELPGLGFFLKKLISSLFKKTFSRR